MSNYSVEELISLYNTFKSDRDDQINEATQIIKALYENLDSILLHIQMYEQCGDLTLKKNAVFSIKNMIEQHSNDDNEEIRTQLQQWLIESLQIETDENLCKYLCDIVLCMVVNWSDFDYSPLYQLANQLLSTANRQAIGLCLWEKILLQANINEQTPDLIKELFVVASQFLLDESTLIRRSAFELIDMLMGKLFDGIEKNEEFNQILADVETTLTSYAEMIFKSTEVNVELQTFISKYSDTAFDEEIPYFSNNLTPIFELALNTTADQSIPVDVRICVHSLVSAYVRMLLREKISPPPEKLTYAVLHYTVQLTIAACQENREYDSYTFAEDLFNQIVKTVGALDFFIETIQQLQQSEDICERQVALLLIKCFISCMNIEMAKSYLDLTLEIGDCDDEFLVLACCSTISDFISNMNECIILVFDPLSKFLVKYAMLPAAMKNLCQSIKAIQQPPEYFKELIEMLLSNLPKVSLMVAIEILYCVKSSFANYDIISPYDSIFDCSNIAEILFSAIGINEQYRTVVLGCFGNIVTAAPELVRDNLENIFSICEGSLQDYLDPCFSAAAKCVRKLTSYFPESVAPYLEQVIPPMLEIITMKVPDRQEMEIEGNVTRFRKSKCDAMMCLCIIGAEIDEFADQYSELLWTCSNLQTNRTGDQMANGDEEQQEQDQSADQAKAQQEEENEMMQTDSLDKDNNHPSMSSKILVAGAKLFSKRKFEVPSVLTQLIENLYSCTDPDTLVLVLHAIRELILFIPRDSILEDENRNKIENGLISSYTGIYPSFMDVESLTIPDFLRRALFGALLAYADICYDSLSSKAAKFYIELKRELDEPDKLQCAQIIHFLSKVFMYSDLEKVEDGYDLLSIIFSKVCDTMRCFQNYFYINYEILTHIFISLIYIFKSSKEKFESNTNGIMTVVQYFIQNTQIESPEFKLSYQTLYLTLISLYELPIDDDVKAVLNDIHICKNMELVPFIAECFIYATNALGEEMEPICERFATILFSSESWLINTMKSETVQFYFNIVTSISQEDLIYRCNLNESSCHQIVQNIQMCTE